MLHAVTAQEGPGIVIVHPAGQDVELLCTVMILNDSEATAWVISHGAPHRPNALRNGIVTGYSANGDNLIVENIMMNDDRNTTEHECVIITQDTTTQLRRSDPTILFVAGEYQYIHAYRIANSTILQLIIFFSYSATCHSQYCSVFMKESL